MTRNQGNRRIIGNLRSTLRTPKSVSRIIRGAERAELWILRYPADCSASVGAGWSSLLAPIEAAPGEHSTVTEEQPLDFFSSNQLGRRFGLLLDL